MNVLILEFERSIFNMGIAHVALFSRPFSLFLDVLDLRSTSTRFLFYVPHLSSSRSSSGAHPKKERKK